MATLIGQGFIEIIPRLASNFGPQLEAQLMGGTKTATASAIKQAETAGTQAGSNFATNMGKAAPAMETSLAGGTKTAAASAVKNAESGGLQAGSTFATQMGKAGPAMETSLAGGTKTAAASAVKNAETGGLQAGSNFASSLGKAGPAMETSLAGGTTSAAAAAVKNAETGGLQAGSTFATSVGKAGPELESQLTSGTTSAATAAITAAEQGGVQAGTQFASAVGSSAPEIESGLVTGTTSATAAAATAAETGGTEAGTQFATGISNSASEIENNLDTAVSTATASAATEAGTGGAEAGSNFAEGINTAADAISSNLSDATSEGAAAAGEAAADGGASAGSSFADGITSAAGEISDKLKEGVDGAKPAGEGAAGEGGIAAAAAFTAHMREALAGTGAAGLSGMIKAVLGVAAVAGVTQFATSAVSSFQTVAGESLKLQRIMGGTIEEASSWRAVGDRYGVTADQMGTSMKTLARQMTATKGPLKDLHIETMDAHGAMLPMGDVLLQISDKFKNMPDGAAKSRLAVQLFGKQGLDLLPILNQGRDGIDRVIGKAKDYGIILDEKAIPKAKALKESQWDLKASMEGVKDAIGEKLAPAFTSFNNFLADKVVPALGAVFGWLDKNKEVIGPVAGLVLVYAAAAGAAAAAQWAWNAAMAANPITVVVGAIAACVVAVVELGLHWDQVWSWIKNHPAIWIVIAALGALTLPIFAIVAACNWLYNNWDRVWSGIKSVALTAWAGIQGAFNAISGWFQRLPGYLATALSAVVRFFTELPGNIVDFFTKLPGRITGFLSQAGQWLLSAGASIITGLWHGIQTAVPAVWSFFLSLPGKILSFVGSFASLLLSAGVSLLTGLWHGIQTAVPAIFSFFIGLPGRILGWVIGFAVLLVRAGIALLTGLWRGITTALPAIVNFFIGLPGRILGWVIGFAVLLVRAGISLLTGLWHGIQTAVPAVWNFFIGLPGKLLSFFGSVLSWLWDVGKKILTGLWNGITNGAEAVWGFFTGLPGKIWSFLGEAGTWLIDTGKKIIGSWDGYQGLFGGFHTAWDNIVSWFTGLPGTIGGFFKDAGKWLLNGGISIGEGLVNGIIHALNFGVDAFVNVPIKAVNGIIDGFNDIPLIPDIPKIPEVNVPDIPDVHIPRVATGGNILSGGMAMVGELGPELVNLPTGSTVYPNSMLGSVGGGAKMGPDIISGLIGGMTDTVRNSATTVKRDVTDPLIKYFTDAFGIASPSKLTTRYGTELIDGLTKGMADRLPQINKSTGDIVGRLNTVSSGASRVVGQVGTSVDQYRTHVGSMATVTESATGRVTKAHGAQSGAVTLLASTNTVRTNAINAAALGMAGTTEGASKRVGAAHGAQGGAVTLLQAVHATRTGQINAANLGMAGHTDAVTGRVKGQHAGQGASITNLAVVHGARTGAINFASLVMAANTDQTTARINTQHLSHASGLTNLATTHGLRTSAINLASLGMAATTDQTTSRINTQHLSHGTGITNLATTHGTRTGQINTAALGMATTTETSTGRVNTAYSGMQAKVDSLHGKDINIASLANVKYPPAAQLAAALTGSINALAGVTGTVGTATLVADGAIFNRVNGGIDNLPDQALISPARGPGIVNWAEAETGGEAFIPLAASKRSRSLAIWERTGELLGAFATGGLLDINTHHSDGNWYPQTGRLQTDTEHGAIEMGKVAAQGLAQVAANMLASAANIKLSSLLTPPGSVAGVADSNQVVAFAKSLIGSPYRPPYYSPAGFSCDGFVWYVFKHFGVDLPKGATNQMNAVQRLAGASMAQPGDVVGFHQRGPSAGNPFGLEFHHIGLVTGADQMIDALGSAYGVRVDSISAVDNGPGHYVRYGRVLQNLNPGWGTGAILKAGKGGGNQREMEAALAAAGGPLWREVHNYYGVVSSLAHIFGAIGMGETGGYNFPTSNNQGDDHKWHTYHGPWAFQEGSWPGVNMTLLDHNLAYAAAQVVKGYNQLGWNPWRMDCPMTGPGNYTKFLAEGGIRTYDSGGYLPPGLSLAYNGTGKPEPVGTSITTMHNTVNLSLNIANGDPVTMRAAAQQVVDDALTALARRLSSGAGRN